MGPQSLQCGRRVDILKLWITWLYYGRKGISERVDKLFTTSRKVADLINENEAYVNTVQNALARNFDFDEKNEKTEYLREALFTRVQDYPDVVPYSEMLIWMLLQQESYTDGI